MIKAAFYSKEKSEVIAHFESYEVFSECYKVLNKMAGRKGMKLVHQTVEKRE